MNHSTFTTTNITHKIIWMYWDQGEYDESVPPLNKLCIDRWKTFNRDTWSVRVLDRNTIRDYVPEFFDILKCSARERPVGSGQSDLLRLLLLSKFGGVWVDASVYPMLPLDLFINFLVSDSNKFFSYWFFEKSIDPIIGNRIAPSWFLVCTQPAFALIEKWKTEVIKTFTADVRWKYFNVHECLSNLYESDSEITQILDDMIKIDQKFPHSALKPNSKLLPSFMYKRPCAELLTIINDIPVTRI